MALYIGDTSPLTELRMHMPSRLLCVGNDLDHLESRCAVLSSAGYDARSATVAEAVELLRTQEFDLVIISAWLEEREKTQTRKAAGQMPVLVLTGLTLADQLLAEVERMFAQQAERGGLASNVV